MTWTQRPQKPPFADPPTANEEHVRLIGPFHISHETEGLVIAGDQPSTVLVASLSEGTLVLGIYLDVSEGFDGGDADLDFGPLGFTEDGENMVGISADTAGSGTDARALVWNSSFIPFITDAGVSVSMVDDDPAPTAGEADIYVVVAG